MKHIALISLFALPGLTPAGVSALELDMPGVSVLAHEESESTTTYTLPVSPWLGTGVEMVTAQGALSRSVWQIEDYAGTSTLLMAHLRNQLETQGFQAIFACDATLCGGFDFRFAMDVTPEPAMHVDLGNFSYLVARTEAEGGDEYIGLLTSRGGQKGYVHMVRISPSDLSELDVGVSTRSPDQETIRDLAAALDLMGTATLADLQFDTGSSTLTDQDYPTLNDLATYLADRPDVRVALVGHTDAEGSLDNNIALSRARADAVRSYLIDVLGAEPAQLEAEGVGYLAPVANNSSTEGRQQNRRVEVVITSTR